jgi:hypothetical protein
MDNWGNKMREQISVVGGLLTGFIGLFIASIALSEGQIAVAGTYLIASAFSFGLIAIASAINGKRQH